MEVTGWKGGTYGLRISRPHRDRYFKKGWKTVGIHLGRGNVLSLPLSDSFWKDCIELRTKDVGIWMRNRGDVPWPKGKPPRYELIPLQNGEFELIP